LRVDDERQGKLADIYKTSALQNTPGHPRLSENIYRSTRVVHNSSIIKPLPFPKAMGKAIREGKNSHIKGSMPSRCVCLHEHCIFLDDEQHMEKFLHLCPAENMCDKRGDQEVCSAFLIMIPHSDTSIRSIRNAQNFRPACIGFFRLALIMPVSVFLLASLHHSYNSFFCEQHLHHWLHPSDLKGKTDEILTGWNKENKISPVCVPHRAASMYQNHQPRVAYNPRGGFRPLKVCVHS